jgi:hypothetical protein
VKTVVKGPRYVVEGVIEMNDTDELPDKFDEDTGSAVELLGSVEERLVAVEADPMMVPIGVSD